MAKSGINLNSIVSKTATKWKSRAREDRSNRRKISRAQAFALELLDYMDAHDLKQKDLADKMKVSAQQVNKILRAKSNLTFDTLDNISEALGIEITTPKIKENKKTFFQNMGRSMQVVHKRRKGNVQEDVITQPTSKKNPILDTSFTSMNEYSYTADKI